MSTTAAQTLRIPLYRNYVAGALVGSVGGWMVRTAQIVLAVEVSNGNGVFVGATTAAQYVPTLMFSALVGALADRRSKAALLIVGEVMMVLAGLGQVVLLPLSSQLPWLIVASAFVFGLGSAVDGPLRTAVVPALVPHEAIPRAVSLNVVIFQIGRVIGPAITGWFIVWLGYGPTFTISALLVGVFICTLPRLIKLSSPPADAERGSIREGFGYLFRNRTLLTVFLLVGVGGIVGPNLLTLSALFVREVFGGGATEIGYASTALAVGAFLGALWAARRKTLTVQMLAVVTMLVGVSAVVTALAPALLAYLALLAISGAFALAMVSMGTALVQAAVSGPMRGRVTGLYYIILIAGAPIGAPLLGLMADAWGARVSEIVSGTAVALLALGAVISSRRSVPVSTEGTEPEIVE